jgi:predicted RNA binding protein YcfA (HicA-like mRNA interferase family)
VKHADLVRLLRENGCKLQRDCGKHTVWVNLKSGAFSAVPRHKEVKKNTAKAICRQLGVDTDGISLG